MNMNIPGIYPSLVTCIHEKERVSVTPIHGCPELRDKLAVLIVFQTRKGDGLPPRICQSCATRLASAYQFNMLAEVSFKKLSAELNSKTPMLKQEPGEQKVSFENLPAKVKDEFLLSEESSETEVEDRLLFSNFQKDDLDLNMVDLQLRADDDDFIILEVGGRQSPYSEMQIDEVKIEDSIIEKQKVKRVRKLKKGLTLFVIFTLFTLTFLFKFIIYSYFIADINPT